MTIKTVETTMDGLRRRESRQIRLEQALRFGISEASRHHSVQREIRKVSILPPIFTSEENQALKDARKRAKSICTVRPPDRRTSYGYIINTSRPIKLPKIPQSRKSSVKNEDGHWHIPARRVSLFNNKLIVDHLRHRLVRQHEIHSHDYEEVAMKIDEEQESSITGIGSEDEEMIQWIQSVRSRAPSLSTLNFSSTGTSRQNNRDHTGESPDLSHCHTPVSLASQNGPQISHLPPRLLSRPSICISFEAESLEEAPDNDVRKSDYVYKPRKVAYSKMDSLHAPSQLTRSLNKAEKSVNLLMQRARHRSVFTDLLESTQENKLDQNGRHLGRRRGSFRHANSLREDSEFSDVPIGEVSLFTDWATEIGSPSMSRCDSFMTDHPPLDFSYSALSRHNTFLNGSRPNTAGSVLVSSDDLFTHNHPENLINWRTEFSDWLDAYDITFEKRQESLKAICHGDVAISIPQFKQKICIYFSSATNDTDLERSFLIDTVTSKLRHYCGQRGLQFELIDLNSIPSELNAASSVDPQLLLLDNWNQSAIRLRLELIKKCFETSIGPCFMSFLADTSGLPSQPPSFLPGPIFESVTEAMDKERQILETNIYQMNEELELHLRNEENNEATNEETKNPTDNELLYNSEKVEEVKRDISNLEEKLHNLNFQKSFMCKWYLIDTNRNPPVHKMKLVSRKDCPCREEKASQTSESESKGKYLQYKRHIENLLRNILTSYTNPQDYYQFREEKLMKTWRNEMLTTAIEAESRLASSASSVRTSRSCFWFRRKLSDVAHGWDNIKRIVQTSSVMGEVDWTTSNDGRCLADHLIKKFTYASMREYSLPWQSLQQAYRSRGSDKTNRDWLMYNERLRNDFFNVCTAQVDSAVHKERLQDRDFILEEIQQHVMFAQSHLSHFVGRNNELKKIKLYLRSRKNRKPFITYGEAGSGKSAILSVAALMAPKWMSSSRRRSDVTRSTRPNSSVCRVIFRSINVTNSSVYPQSLLSGICFQLRCIAEELSDLKQPEDQKNLPKHSHKRKGKIFDLDFKNLATKFSNLLSECGNKVPVLIFIDNIGDIRHESDARTFKWIPKLLPKFVKIIMSLTGSKESCETYSPDKPSILNRLESLKRIKKVSTTGDASSEIDDSLPTNTDCFLNFKLNFDIAEDTDETNTSSNLFKITSLSINAASTSSNDFESSQTEFSDVLRGLLSSQNRSLTNEQLRLVEQSCRHCPQPLIGALCVRLSRDWTSHTPLDECRPCLPHDATNIEAYFHSFFVSLETNHGRPLVSAALCFVTLSLHGLTRTELFQLLSYDRNVSNWITKLCAKVFQFAVNQPAKELKSPNKKPSISRDKLQKKSNTNSNQNKNNKKGAGKTLEKLTKTRIPDLLWQRLLTDLEYCFIESLSDKALTLHWKHTIFAKVCTSRYMNSKEQQSYYRNILALYFSDNIPNEDLYSYQPMLWQQVQTTKPAKKESTSSSTDDVSLYFTSHPCYNLRRLSESFHQYLHCRTLEEIKKEMLCNHEWLLAKLRGTTYEELIRVFSLATAKYQSDKDLQLLVETLKLSHDVLVDHPCQLASQLVGRLHSIIKSDKPLARMDPRKYPHCRMLMAQCRRSSIPVLIPSNTCLASPGDIMFDFHLGHRDVIHAIAMTSDGQRVLTSSRDETIKVWNLSSRQVTATLEDMPRYVLSLTLCLANNYVAVLDKSNKIKVVSLRTGESILSLVESERHHVVMTVAGDGQTHLLVFNDEMKSVKVWDLDKVRLFHKIDISLDYGNLRKDQCLIVGNNAKGFIILFSFKSTDKAYVYDVKRAKHLQTLKLQHELGQALITHVEVSREYYVIACKRQYMRLHEIVTFELYDSINYGHVRTIRGCPEDTIVEFYINRLGSHLIGLIKGVTGSEIGVWNVESGSHQHMACQKFHSTKGCCMDLQYLVTVSDTKKTSTIYNLAARIDDKTVSRTQVKKNSLGIGQFYPVTKNSRYIVARGMENGPITVWNITRGRCKGEAVSIERGLLEKNDVVIVKDVTVIVLSERGISSMEDGSQLVFKTIYIYDLTTKKYIKKLNPVEITVCPPDEYKMLGMDRLLAVSCDRLHFVIWSLNDGQILSKIMPDYSKYELAEVAAKEVKESRFKRKRDTRRKHYVKSTATPRAKPPPHLSSDDRSRLIDQILLSADENTLLCSFYGRHVAVFDVPSKTHTHTLIDQHSMLLLHQAQITRQGCHLVHTNYDDHEKFSYLTVWDLRQGHLERRLRNEPLVCALAVSENASKIVFATEDNYLKIWEPFKRGGHHKIPGYSGLRMRQPGVDCQGTTVYLTSTAKRAILFTYDISLWNLEESCVLARFTPDVPFRCCTVAMNGNLIIAGMRDTTNVVTLRLMSRDCDVTQYGRAVLGSDVGVFGEKEEKDSESSEDETIQEEEEEEDDR